MGAEARDRSEKQAVVRAPGHEERPAAVRTTGERGGAGGQVEVPGQGTAVVADQAILLENRAHLAEKESLCFRDRSAWRGRLA